MIFNPINLNGVNLKNRIIRSATHDGLADEFGAPSDRLIKRYENLAKNNVGCIITGYAAVSKNGVSPYPAMLKIYDDSNLDKYKELVDSVHKYNTPIVLQIAHCGRQTSSKIIGVQKVAPTPKFHMFYPDKAKELNSEEIKQIINDFINAAIRAEKCGFDAVQLHGGHGYLLHDFLSPYGNNRKDEWGGNTENRCKIVVDIIKGIKEKTNLPVWLKLSAQDNRRNGMRINESIKIAKILEKAGLDVLEVSCGSVQDGMNTMRSKKLPMEAVFKYKEPFASWWKPFKSFCLFFAKLFSPLIKQPKPLNNFNVENASLLKNELSIPIIVVGGISKLEKMNEIIENNKADAISMCRPFICEPNFVSKLKKGEQNSSKCIMCNYCGLVIEKEATRCLYGKIK